MIGLLLVILAATVAELVGVLALRRRVLAPRSLHRSEECERPQLARTPALEPGE